MKNLFVFIGLFSPAIVALRRSPTGLWDYWSPSNRKLIEFDDTTANRNLQDEVLKSVRQERNIESAFRSDDLPTPFDHIVSNMPYLKDGSFPTPHYAGHLPASEDDDKKFFYWLFEPDLSIETTNPEDIPLLIWMNGGPGCSSMDGLWLENGPFRLTSPKNSQYQDWTIEINQYSWHKAPAYVLYIDQPVGTGLSFTKKRKFCKNDHEVNIDFHYFLQTFLQVYDDFFLQEHPEVIHTADGEVKEQFRMSRPLYFSGESHAGHYIPSMIDYILEKNGDTSSKGLPQVFINVRGGAIGNGWVDPIYQYAATDISYGMGIIDLAQKEGLDSQEMQCRDQLNAERYTSKTCFDLLDRVINQSHGSGGSSIVSTYDNRIWEKRGESRNFPPGHKDVERYLGGWQGDGYPEDMTIDYHDVLRAIHAEESVIARQRYEECTDPPYNALLHQDGLGVVNEVVRILNHPDKPRLFFFNGVNDIICNHVGNEKFLDKLPWTNRDEWIMAQRSVWDAHGSKNKESPSGYMKEFENLSFLKVLSSGHMVPMDVPDVALIMIRTFLYNGSFSQHTQNLNGVIPDDSCSCPTCVINEKDDYEDSYYETEEDELVRQMLKRESMKNGSVGVLLGILLTVSVVILTNRRACEKRSRIRSDMTSLQADSDDRYSDNHNVELT